MANRLIALCLVAGGADSVRAWVEYMRANGERQEEAEPWQATNSADTTTHAKDGSARVLQQDDGGVLCKFPDEELSKKLKELNV